MAKPHKKNKHEKWVDVNTVSDEVIEPSQIDGVILNGVRFIKAEKAEQWRRQLGGIQAAFNRKRSNVYLVYWCNNETYEDYRYAVEGVFSSYKSAENYILNSGYHKNPIEGHSWINTTSKWNKEADIYDGQVFEVHSMWIKEMKLQ